MKSFKELLAPLRQKELSFATKQWIIIIVSVLIGACLSNWDDYLYRNNDVGRWIGLIGDHHVEGMYRGFQFALAVVLINIISRILKDKRVLKQPKELKAATIIGITALGLFAVVFHEVVLCNLEGFPHTLAYGDAGDDNDEFAPPIVFVQLEHGLDVDIGLTCTSLHLNI